MKEEALAFGWDSSQLKALGGLSPRALNDGGITISTSPNNTYRPGKTPVVSFEVSASVNYFG